MRFHLKIAGDKEIAGVRVASGANEAGNNDQPRTTTTTNEDPERLAQFAADLYRFCHKKQANTRAQCAICIH